MADNLVFQNAPEPAMKNARSIKTGYNNKSSINSKSNSYKQKNNILCIIMSFEEHTMSSISIYYDRSGFGSEATTLQDAKTKDASITQEDVGKFC